MLVEKNRRLDSHLQLDSGSDPILDNYVVHLRKSLCQKIGQL